MARKAVQLFSIMLTLMGLVRMMSGPTTVVAAPAPQGDKTIMEVMVEDGRFTTLVSALQTTALDSTLNGPGPFTLFAPTDEVFAALPAEKLQALLADTAALKNVLRYHIWWGEVRAAEVAKLGAADTLLGWPVQITVEGNTIKLDQARIVNPDIAASNGVIHVIDAVLQPLKFPPGQPDYDRPHPPPMDPGGPDGYKPSPPDQGQDDHAYSYPPPPHYSPNSYYYLPTPYGYYGPYGGGYGRWYGYYDYKGYTRWWHLPRHYH